MARMHRNNIRKCARLNNKSRGKIQENIAMARSQSKGFTK
jgi:hypothetical protein